MASRGDSQEGGGGEAEAVVEGGITERGAAELIRIAHGRVQIPERIRRLWGIGDGDLVVWVPPETGQLEAKLWPGRVVRRGL